MAKETLVPGLGFGPFELVANDPADGQAGTPATFLEPVSELGRKTNCYCMTHIIKS
jgi:hypothetical protein